MSCINLSLCLPIPCCLNYYGYNFDAVIPSSLFSILKSFWESLLHLLLFNNISLSFFRKSARILKDFPWIHWSVLRCSMLFYPFFCGSLTSSFKDVWWEESHWSSKKNTDCASVLHRPCARPWGKDGGQLDFPLATKGTWTSWEREEEDETDGYKLKLR